MSELDCPGGENDWTDLEFGECKRTSEEIVEVGILSHLARLSLLNTKQDLERLGVERGRTATHSWMQKANLQPTDNRFSNYFE